MNNKTNYAVDQLCSEELSIKLKSLGYSQSSFTSWYDKKGKLHTYSVPIQTRIMCNIGYVAPTLTAAQRFLREEKEVFVLVLPQHNRHSVVWTTNFHNRDVNVQVWEQWEDAMENGLLAGVALAQELDNKDKKTKEK